MGWKTVIYPLALSFFIKALLYCHLLLVCFHILILWPFPGGGVKLPAALDQLARVEAPHQATGHSEGSGSAPRLLWQDLLHSTARRPAWGRATALSGSGRPGVWRVTSEWACPSGAKRAGRYDCQGSQARGFCMQPPLLKTVFKCLCLGGCVQQAVGGPQDDTSILTPVIEALEQKDNDREVNWGFLLGLRVWSRVLPLWEGVRSDPPLPLPLPASPPDSTQRAMSALYRDAP